MENPPDRNRAGWTAALLRRLTRLMMLLLDGGGECLDAALIVACDQLNIIGQESQHRGLILEQWLGCVEPDRGGSGDAAFLLAGDAACIHALVYVGHPCLLFWFFLAPACRANASMAGGFQA